MSDEEEITTATEIEIETKAETEAEAETESEVQAEDDNDLQELAQRLRESSPLPQPNTEQPKLPDDAGQLLQQIVEGALLASGKILTIEQLQALFDEGGEPSKADIKKALQTIQKECEGRGFELLELSSGWRFQVRQPLSPWVSRLWEEKPQRYSRALLETLALIAYRQPITRGEIEEVRGVAVSSNIIRTLVERQWVRVVGHRDVPGRPAMYATTKDFLDYFNLPGLESLPSLAQIKDLDDSNQELDLGDDADKADTLEAIEQAPDQTTDVAAVTEFEDAEGFDEQKEIEMKETRETEKMSTGLSEESSREATSAADQAGRLQAISDKFARQHQSEES